MTLFKQLALLISLFLLIILTTVLTLNFQSANTTVQEQLYEDAKNTASSLSLSLSTADGDESILATMINANFDSGHYRSISLYSQKDELMYERKIEQNLEDVPEFFVKILDIEIPTASAQVSAGWSPIGILYVQSDSSYAYRHLYKILIQLLVSFTVLATIGLIILNVLIHVMLKPLKKIQQQSEAILDNNFILQEEIPYTIEFRDVVKGMNVMVEKVEGIFNAASEATKRNRELLYNDPITTLFNRKYMVLKLPDILEIENRENGGSLLFLALSGAEVINSVLGRQGTDELFLDFSTELKYIALEYEDSLVSRVNGTEFTLVLPACTSDDCQRIVESILRVFATILQKYNITKDENVDINIGVYRYFQGSSVAEVLTKADSALTLAKADTKANVHCLEEIEAQMVLGKEQWRNILHKTLTQDSFILSFRDIITLNSSASHHKIMTFFIEDSEFGRLEYGKYIPFALTFNLVDDIYSNVLKKLFLMKEDELDSKVVAVRLPTEFLKQEHSILLLEELFKSYAHQKNFKLIFEVSDSFALKNISLLETYNTLFKTYGYAFALNQFSAQSDEYSYLKTLKPLYIKADAKFLIDQSSEAMSSLRVITDSIGADIIASFVESKEQVIELTDKKIDSFQGPYTSELTNG